MAILCVGDSHNLDNYYLSIIKDHEYSLQVGDLGLNYSKLRSANVNWCKNRAIAGNHDNYQTDSPEHFAKQPFFLGNYGLYVVDGKQIFYMRGGWSIDWYWRQEQQKQGGEPIWWEDEELFIEECDKAISLYTELKPDLVVTHECPLEIVQHVTDPTFVRRFGFTSGVIPTRTNQTLQTMFDIHQPAMWIFGHYHQRKEVSVKNTNFVCLDQIRGAKHKGCQIELS